MERAKQNGLVIYIAAGAAAVGLLGLAWYLSRPGEAEEEEAPKNRQTPAAPVATGGKSANTTSDGESTTAAVTSAPSVDNVALDTSAKSEGGGEGAIAASIPKSTLRRVLIDMISKLEQLKVRKARYPSEGPHVNMMRLRKI